jgi:hypothetical protein
VQAIGAYIKVLIKAFDLNFVGIFQRNLLIAIAAYNNLVQHFVNLINNYMAIILTIGEINKKKIKDFYPHPSSPTRERRYCT